MSAYSVALGLSNISEDNKMSTERLTRRDFLTAASAALVGLALPFRKIQEVSAGVDYQSIPVLLHIRMPDGTPGIFDRRANGGGDNPATNTNLEGYVMSGPLLQAYEEKGGDMVWGPIVSRAFVDANGRLTQYTQRGGFQVTTEGARLVLVEWDNIFDRLRNAEVGLDDEENMVPRYGDWSLDSQFSWGHNEQGGFPNTIEANHISIIFDKLQRGISSREQGLIKGKFLSNPDWFNQHGLPMGIKKYANGVVAAVCQRCVFHLWPDTTPWSAKDDPVIVLGGDVLKKVVQAGRVRGYVDREVFSTEVNPFPSGGGSIDQTSQVNISPRERQIIQTTTLVDSATVPGKSVPSVEVRSSLGANSKIAIKPELKDELARLVDATGKAGALVEYESLSQIPVGVEMKRGGNATATGLTYLVYTGSEVVDNKVIVYVVSMLSNAVLSPQSQGIVNDRYVRGIVSGGDTTSSAVASKPEYLRLIQREPFVISA